MATTVADVLSAIGARVPLAKAAGWDPVGLQVGDPRAAVSRAAVAHEITDEVIGALDDDVELLIAYHPLLFDKVDRFVAGTTPSGRAYRLARRGVALAVVHTAFDVAPGGCADALADALGLAAPRGFAPAWPADTAKVVVFAPEEDADGLVAAMAAAGAGEIGTYGSCSFRVAGTGTFFAAESAAPATGSAGTLNREPEVRIEMVAPRHRIDAVVAAVVSVHRYEEPAYDVVDLRANAGFVGRIGRLDEPVPLRSFAARVAEVLETPVRVAGDPTRPVQTVAVVPGAGSGFVDTLGGAADVLVTGDVPHHAARRALDRGVAVVDAGHVPTERPGLRALVPVVSSVVPTSDLTAIDPHPWKE
jgi:dinuclear metal center YbgI/SA1388 family protein